MLHFGALGRWLFLFCSGAVCVSQFPRQPFGNFGVQNVVKLQVFLAQDAPRSVAGQKFNLILIQPIFINCAIGKAQAEGWKVSHRELSAWLEA